MNQPLNDSLALTTALYDELRSLAGAHMRRENPGHTLSTTALVHEAFLRLAQQRSFGDGSREDFLKAAGVTMRRVLVDYARERRAAKRGGGRVSVTLDDTLRVTEEAADLVLVVDEALSRLREVSERLAQVVECRFFGGLSEEETAIALGINERTVRRDWVKAKGWLYAELADVAP